jgi:phage tail sheath protein FI
MATSYTIPGVYVEEVSTGARPIEAVGTSTAAFLGYVRDYPPSTQALAVNNLTEFRSKVIEQSAYRTPADGSSPPSDTPALFSAVFGFFANGGSRCYIVALDQKNNLTGGAKGRAGLDLLETVDDVAIVAAPGLTDPASYDALLSHCETMKDRVAVLDTPKDVPDITALTQAATTAPKSGAKPAEGAPAPVAALGPRKSQNGYGAVYYPWIQAKDVITGDIADVPPSGHIAGIYARVDATRGVFKAPANEPVVGATGLTIPVPPQDQGVLNPAGVNCIRSLSAGILVWGARTVASDAEWRYVPVRRLFCMIEKSIEQGTRWVVFEPNDEVLWKAIRRDVGAFLTLLWRQGALRGTTPEQAFFVKCDAETNPPDVIDAGQVVILVGIAPVKPAEFVIFRIGQSSSGATTTEQTGEAGKAGKAGP